MKLKLLVFCVLLGYAITASAQNDACTFSVSGKIRDANTNEPVPFAVVKVDGSDKYATATAEGNFKIDGLCSKTNTLIISSIGFIELTVEHTGDANTTFSLNQEVTGLDGVTIQGERAKEAGTESISQVVLDQAVIKSIPTQSLGTALATIQGVTFASVGNNVQLPIIHGLSGNRILVLNNGIKHGFQNWGEEHAPEIDITSANKITIIKGASGVRYGPEALGGAILVESTALDLNNPLYANVGVSGETNGLGFNTNFKLGEGTEKWSYYLNGSFTQIGDRRAADYNLTNSGKEELALGAGVLHRHKNWTISARYSFLDQNLGILRTSFLSSPDAFIRSINADQPVIIEPLAREIREPNQDTQHHLAKVQVDWQYSEEGKLSFIGGYQLNKRQEFDVRRNADAPIVDLDLVTNDYQLEWKHPSWNGLEGLIGVQYFSQNNDNNPGTFASPIVPNYNIERVSSFVIEKIEKGQNTFEAGLRFDFETNDVRGREPDNTTFRDEYDFTNVTASLGYVRQFAEGYGSFRSNLGTAWRTANPFELFSFGQNRWRRVFGLLRIRNVDGAPNTDEVTPFDSSQTEAERGFKFINELKINKEENQHVLTFYSNYIENYLFDRPILVTQTVRGPTLAFLIDQADALFIGADYNWRTNWTTDISTDFGFSYLWTRNIGDDESLIHQPPISTSLSIQWDQGEFLGLSSSVWKLKPSYTFEQFQAPRTIPLEDIVDGSAEVNLDSEIFDVLDPPEGYFLLDLSWNFGWKNFSGSVAVQNVLNNGYRSYLNDLRYFADEPGTNVVFSLNYQFQSGKNKN
ncbi:MAG: TonB-dependent receptor [Bacteroidota bacterium]